eukprot:4782965-Pleurochrysis_carterae.AAC.1
MGAPAATADARDDHDAQRDASPPPESAQQHTNARRDHGTPTAAENVRNVLPRLRPTPGGGGLSYRC